MILVTGSQGLIGKELVKKIGIDRSILVDVRLQKSAIGCVDIRSKQIKDLINKASGIVHLAAVSRVVDAENNPNLCWDVNATGTSQLLQWCFESRKKPWFIYASSREVYGQQNKFPIHEDASYKPVNIYARSKVAAEESVKAYKQKGLKTGSMIFAGVWK